MNYRLVVIFVLLNLVNGLGTGCGTNPQNKDMLFPVKIKDEYRYVDENYKIVVQTEYDHVDYFSEGPQKSR